MSQDPDDIRQLLSHTDNALTIENAQVEDISTPKQLPRYLTVTYDAIMRDGAAAKQTLRLNTDENTTIMNAFGIQVDWADIHIGSLISAQFSADIAMSNPPQALAFIIIIQQSSRPVDAFVTTDWVASVDVQNGLIYTGNPRSLNSQKRFVVTAATQTTNQNGTPISLTDIIPGHIVRIIHAEFETGCLPPQAIAYMVQQF